MPGSAELSPLSYAHAGTGEAASELGGPTRQAVPINELRHSQTAGASTCAGTLSHAGVYQSALRDPMVPSPTLLGPTLHVNAELDLETHLEMEGELQCQLPAVNRAPQASRDGAKALPEDPYGAGPNGQRRPDSAAYSNNVAGMEIGLEFKPMRRRTKITTPYLRRDCAKVLQEWFLANLDRPYPSAEDKLVLEQKSVRPSFVGPTSLRQRAPTRRLQPLPTSALLRHAVARR